MGRDGFEDFCESQWPRLVSALDFYCGDLLLAEEFAQEAMLRTYVRWHRVRKMASPAAFTYRIGMNLANSHWRRKRAEQRAYARSVNVGDVQEDTADAVAVRQALASLQPRHRAAVVLRYWVGMSAIEGAEVFAVTPGAFRALTHRAMESLRDQLGASSTSMTEVLHDR